jgi:hypothetical protein
MAESARASRPFRWEQPWPGRGTVACGVAVVVPGGGLAPPQRTFPAGDDKSSWLERGNRGHRGSVRWKC